MSAKIDPVEVARRMDEWVAGGEPYIPLDKMELTGPEVAVVSKVVLAASERVKYGHDHYCDYRRWTEGVNYLCGMPGCNCGHDALDAALKGECDDPSTRRGGSAK